MNDHDKAWLAYISNLLRFDASKISAKEIEQWKAAISAK